MNRKCPADTKYIPKPLQCLNWRNTKLLNEVQDGDQYLMAVPVRLQNDDPDKWSYMFDIITVVCDDNFITCEVDGEEWGWGLFDADFFVKIR